MDANRLCLYGIAAQSFRLFLMEYQNGKCTTYIRGEDCGQSQAIPIMMAPSIAATWNTLFTRLLDLSVADDVISGASEDSSSTSSTI